MSQLLGSYLKKNTTWKINMQIMCYVIWHLVIVLFFFVKEFRFVLVLSKEIIRSSKELGLLTRVGDHNTAKMEA